MKWIGYVIAFAVGVLAIVIPMVQGWNPENEKAAIGFGIGVVLATAYALWRGIPATAKAGAPMGGPGVTVNFGGMEWYDWVVLIVLVFGGLLVGLIA
jgi:hypothetical protein